MTESADEMTIGQLKSSLDRRIDADPLNGDAQSARFGVHKKAADLGLSDDAPISALPADSLAWFLKTLGSAGAASAGAVAELAHDPASLLAAVGLDEHGSPKDAVTLGSIFAPGSAAAEASPALSNARYRAEKAHHALSALEAGRHELLFGDGTPQTKNARWALLMESAHELDKLGAQLEVAHQRVQAVAESYARKARDARVPLDPSHGREIRDRLAAMPADQRSELLAMAKLKSNPKPFAALLSDPIAELQHSASDLAEWRSTLSQLAAPHETALADAYSKHARRAADAAAVFKDRLKAIKSEHGLGLDKRGIQNAAAGIVAARLRQAH